MKWWQNERQLRLKMRERHRRRQEARRIRNIRLARGSLGIVDKPTIEVGRMVWMGMTAYTVEFSEAGDEQKW